MVWIESVELNPRAKSFFPDTVKALVDRYGFLKYPQKLEEFDETKGITFASGRFNKQVIEQIQIFTYGLVLDTRISTEESKRLLEEALVWASDVLGINYDPKKTYRWQYVSSLTFTSDVFPKSMPRPVRSLAESVSQALGSSINENRTYEVVNLSLDYDQLTRKHPLGAFTIQRRENTPFGENKYFSSAPLPTEMHLKLLQNFEQELATG
jgi:hypothetical protein